MLKVNWSTAQKKTVAVEVHCFFFIHGKMNFPHFIPQWKIVEEGAALMSNLLISWALQWGWTQAIWDTWTYGEWMALILFCTAGSIQDLKLKVIHLLYWNWCGTVWMHLWTNDECIQNSRKLRWYTNCEAQKIIM